MGVFVAHGSIGKLTFARKDAAVWDAVLKDIRASVDVARRVHAKSIGHVRSLWKGRQILTNRCAGDVSDLMTVRFCRRGR